MSYLSSIKMESEKGDGFEFQGLHETGGYSRKGLSGFTLSSEHIKYNK
jgi:hypothetical protein